MTLRGELARKGLHLSSVTVPVLYANGLDRTPVLVFLGVALLVAIAVEVTRLRVGAVGEAFDRLAGPLLREREHRHWSGATWLLLSFVVVVALFPRPVAVAAMWGVAVGDASAGIVGRAASGRWGNVRGKTLAGSIACAVVTTFGALGIAGLGMWESILSGVVAAIAEWPSRPGDDNLRIGLAVGSGILLSRMVFS